jgi:hypothetical protein
LQTPEFLEIADILDIHQILIELFGGMPGVISCLVKDLSLRPQRGRGDPGAEGRVFGLSA